MFLSLLFARNDRKRLFQSGYVNFVISFVKLSLGSFRFYRWLFHAHKKCMNSRKSRCCDLGQRNKKEKKGGGKKKKKEMREIYLYNLSKYRLFPLSPRVFRFLDAYNSLHFSCNTSMHLCITFMFRFSLSYFVLFSYSLYSEWVEWALWV